MKRTYWHLLGVVVLVVGLVGGTQPLLRTEITKPFTEASLFSSPLQTLSIIVTADSAEHATELVRRAGGQVTSDLWLINAVAATLPASQLEALQAQPGIRSITNNKAVGTADTGTGSDLDGYPTHLRVVKGRFHRNVTQVAPVTYLPDNGFVSVDQDGQVLIINSNGTHRATVTLVGKPYYTAAAVRADGTAYFASQTKHIYALQPDGTVRWHTTQPGGAKFYGGAVLSPDGSIVYAVDDERTVYALDANTGKLKWKFRAGSSGSANSTPVVGADGKIFFATEQGYVYAVNPTGTLKWTRNTAVKLYLSPVLAPDGTVVVTSPVNKKVIAINESTGTQKFSFSTSSTAVDNAVIGANGSVFVATENGIYGLNTNGTQRFYFVSPNGNKFLGRPVLSSDGSVVYAPTEDSNLYAINTTTGAQQWKFSLPGIIGAGVGIGPLGELVVGTDQKLLAIVSPDGSGAVITPLADKVVKTPQVDANGDITALLGNSDLIVLGLLPNQWDGRPDVQITSNSSVYNLVNPVAIDVGANLLHTTELSSGVYNRGSGVVVAVLDSGVYFSSSVSSFLDINLYSQFLGQADFVQPTCPMKHGKPVGYQNPDYCYITEKTVSQDGYGHGTHVAGIIWNKFTDLNTGANLGIAPDAKILSVRVLNNDGVGTYESVIKGIQYIVATKNISKVRILNLSLSSPATVPYFVDPLNRAVEQAWASGIVVLAAAGNSGPLSETITVPGNDPYVITVGAVNSNRTPGYWGDDTIPGWSATGPTFDGFAKPDVLAPGSQIVSFMYNNGSGSGTQKLVALHPDYSGSTNLFRMNGTSMATAVTSGVVALMLQANPSLTPDQVKYRLTYSARPALSPDDALVYNTFQQGMGRVWAPDAVLGQFPANGAANADMNIQTDLAHGYDTEADLAYHYQGPILKTMSDDGSADLYYIPDTDGSYLGLGWALLGGQWATGDPLTSGMSWAGARMSWAGGMSWAGSADAFGSARMSWAGARMSWAGGTDPYSVARMSWAGARMSWAGARMSWAGARMSWAGGMSWAGARMSWAGNTDAYSVARMSWAGGINPFAYASSTGWITDDWQPPANMARPTPVAAEVILPPTSTQVVTLEVDALATEAAFLLDCANQALLGAGTATPLPECPVQDPTETPTPVLLNCDGIELALDISPVPTCTVTEAFSTATVAATATTEATATESATATAEPPSPTATSTSVAPTATATITLAAP